MGSFFLFLGGTNRDIGHSSIKSPKFTRLDCAQIAKPPKVPWMLFLNQVYLRVNKNDIPYKSYINEMSFIIMLCAITSESYEKYIIDF